VREYPSRAVGISAVIHCNAVRVAQADMNFRAGTCTKWSIAATSCCASLVAFAENIGKWLPSIASGQIEGVEHPYLAIENRLTLRG
jgi:hypothetical protein